MWTRVSRAGPETTPSSPPTAPSQFIPDEERIVTIEDAAEIKLMKPHVIILEARPPNIEGTGSISIRDLGRNSLRMRPDRIIVGGCRGGGPRGVAQRTTPPP